MSTHDDRETAVHLTEIRRALARRNAAVMVGAGFSRNAEGGERFSTWSEVSTELARRLGLAAESTAFSSAGVTQLGEQFARVFSEPALEDFLKEMVPDERARPGRLHDELLRLEWSDIFTTNYDTLLERSAAKMFERAHFTVCSREDIPLSKVLATRRIVKLHGSFPSQRPFIFTEEQYRTYPDKFAPFVNLVRQSLLENVFCLIGFSGDDPNFLHWLGWVRDMLDGASLPVYLFLTGAPTYGQRSLLLARGVTPVVLPEADSKDPADYSGRYRKLLAALAKPLEVPVLAWGEIVRSSKRPNGNEPQDEQYSSLIDDFVQLSELKQTYPGWLIAPRSVRATFRRQTSDFVERLEGPHAGWLHERLGKEPLVLRLALLALYFWQREVILAPVDDGVAEIAMALVAEVNERRPDGVTSAAGSRLESLGVRSDTDTRRHQRDIGISVLRWARQGLKDDAFAAMSAFLGDMDDSYVEDVVNNEKILFLLQRAQRQQARDTLASWRVRSADPYMSVRRAVLMAELGDVDGAAQACNAAIQHLRESQKIKPKDPQLVSQEAWACLLTDRLLQGRNLWTFTKQQTEEAVVADLSERLQELAARGYSPQRELEHAEAALGAEAMASFENDFRFKAFEIGAVKPVRRFGLAAEFRAKITAAFEWLELADRTGLLPRMPGVTYHSSSYLQAAWWAQYGDSMARVRGILMRTVALDALDPRDPTKPPHRTGWLSRYQIALLSNEEATSGCRSLLSEIEDSTSRNATHPDNRIAIAFQLEVFSRLVVRAEPSVVLELGKRVLRLHQHPGLIQDASNRPRLSTALKHCCEAVPTDQALGLLRAAAIISGSLAAAHAHYRWFLLSDLVFPPFQPPSASDLAEWRPTVLAALQALEHEQTTYTWSAISAMKTLRMLTQDDERRVAVALWGKRSTWPRASVLVPLAPLRWPPPSAEVDIKSTFATWLREQKLAGFGRQIPGTSMFGFPAEVDEQYLEAAYEGLRSQCLAAEDFAIVTSVILNWWREEEATVLDALKRDDAFRDILDERLSRVDQIVWEGRRQFLRGREQRYTDLEVQVQTLIDALANVGLPLIRVSLLDFLDRAECHEANLQLREVANILLGDDNFRIERAHEAVAFLFEHSEVYAKANLDLVLDALCAAAVARHLPGSLKAMHKLAVTALKWPQLLKERHWHACETVLVVLEEELRYVRHARIQKIEDDGVPTYRFVCARLADAVARSGSSVGDSPVVRRWIEAASIDPLPEMRFARFRIQLSE